MGMIGDPDGGVCSNKLTDLVSKLVKPGHKDGDAASTRELGRTLRSMDAIYGLDGKLHY
jgi:hypothetical protein